MINRIDPNFKYLSQRDLKWKAVKIGNSSVDVGHYGCLLTCISMASYLFGEYKTPDVIAKKVELFSNDGSLYWINLGKLFTKFQFRWRDGNIFNGAPVRNDDLIKAYLPGGKRSDDGVVILAVDNNSHWILPIWWDTYKKDYLCIDPWTGNTCYAIERYKEISTSAYLLKTGVAKDKLEPKAPEYK